MYGGIKMTWLLHIQHCRGGGEVEMVGGGGWPRMVGVWFDWRVMGGISSGSLAILDRHTYMYLCV